MFSIRIFPLIDCRIQPNVVNTFSKIVCVCVSVRERQHVYVRRKKEKLKDIQCEIRHVVDYQTIGCNKIGLLVYFIYSWKKETVFHKTWHKITTWGFSQWHFPGIIVKAMLTFCNQFRVSFRRWLHFVNTHMKSTLSALLTAKLLCVTPHGSLLFCQYIVGFYWELWKWWQI